MGGAWRSPRGLLAELAEQKLLGERHALELEQLHVRLHPAVEREPNPPRTREHLGVFDGRFIHHVVRAGRRVALDYAKHVTVIVAGPVEPRLFALAGDVDDQRVTVPAAARPSHP